MEAKIMGYFYPKPTFLLPSFPSSLFFFCYSMWAGVLGACFAFTKASKWRKTAKCKSLIKQLQRHLSIQRSRRECIIRQSRADIAELLRSAQLQKALDRVGQLYKDQQLLCAYYQIENFCGRIITTISHIARQSCWELLPSGAVEAVSSIVFAASRCGELPELHLLRSLFKERYGCGFEMINVELSDGNLVNILIKECLCTNFIPNDLKLMLIIEIAKDYDLPLWFKDYEPQVHKLGKVRVLDLEIKETCRDSDGSRPPRRIDSHFPENGANIYTQVNRNGGMRQRLDSKPQIPKSSVVNPDDLEEKKTCRNVHYRASRVGALKFSARKSVNPGTQSCHSVMEDPLRKNKYMVFENRFSLDVSIDKMKAESGKSPDYVHPKLPEYDDVVDKLASLKAEYKQHGRF